MNKLILSIDGGGTKTVGVLYNELGIEQNRFVGPSSNFAVDKIAANNVLLSVIDNLINDQVSNVIIGIAGYSMVNNIDQLTKKLSDKYQRPFLIMPDAHLGLYSVRNGKLPLIYVIGGTGSIIYGKVGNDISRLGGYGHLFGDKGSAYSISMTLFEDILINLDLRKSLNKLQRAVLKQLKLKTRPELIHYIYQSNKQDIAKFSSLISEYKELTYSKKLLLNEAKIIYNNILYLIKKIKIKDEFKLSLNGGFIENAPFVKNEVIRLLNKKNLNFLLEEDNNEAVYGGYLLYVLSNERTM